MRKTTRSNVGCYLGVCVVQRNAKLVAFEIRLLGLGLLSASTFWTAGCLQGCFKGEGAGCSTFDTSMHCQRLKQLLLGSRLAACGTKAPGTYSRKT